MQSKTPHIIVSIDGNFSSGCGETPMFGSVASRVSPTYKYVHEHMHDTDILFVPHFSRNAVKSSVLNRSLSVVAPTSQNVPWTTLPLVALYIVWKVPSAVASNSKFSKAITTIFRSWQNACYITHT